ncbi:Thiamine-phosphate synthase [compost metagenome]
MKIDKLQYICTTAAQAEDACRSGIKWIQLRLKNTPFPEWKQVALDIQAVCKKYGATFIVNDHVHLAKEINADGVHLGKEDMPPAEAREILGDAFIIGSTANTIEDIEQLTVALPDYIGLGPYRFTSTKEKLSPILGLNGYQTILKRCEERKIHIPVIAIGGLQPEDLPDLMKTGVWGIAVSGTITHAENKEVLIKKLLALSATTELLTVHPSETPTT